MDEFKLPLAEYGLYLEDIRRRLYNLVLVFLVAFVGGFFLTVPFLRVFIKFLQLKDVVITATAPFQIVDLAMNTGLFFATVLSVPAFVYQVYGFIGSGLRRRERKIFFLLLPLSLVLFLAGFAYGFAILYFTMQTLANINLSLGVKNLWDISMFLSQIISTAGLLGLIFEFPIVMTLVIRTGLVSVDFLRSKRRHAILAMFIFASLLPPTDGISLIMMVLPLIVMYEATIVYNIIK